MNVETSHQDALLTALRRVVGAENVLTDADLVAGYLVDWTGRFRGDALAVVRPAATSDVAEVMRLCDEFDTPVIPQGGNTGLVAGAVPAGPFAALPVVVSTRRMDVVGEVDQHTGQLTAAAGATLAAVHVQAERAGWLYGVDLGARESATIGGTIATNAGGIRVVAYGMTRAQVVGIEAVLPGGVVVSHMAGLVKDNTGYDLAGLLCGSEGTLGVITAVRLRLHRPSPPTTVALVGCAGWDDALALLAAVSAGGSQLLAAEVADDTALDIGTTHLGTSWPLADRHPLAVLFEVVDGGDASGLASLDGRDAVIGTDTAERARIWRLRERLPEAFATLGVGHKLDVSVPLAQMEDFVSDLRGVVASIPDLTTFGIFGHLADGNLHVQVHGPAADDLGVDRLILECAARHRGSISAEHGVGRAKAADLHLCRSASEIAAMRAVKSAWDPKGLMNPGVIFQD